MAADPADGGALAGGHRGQAPRYPTPQRGHTLPRLWAATAIPPALVVLIDESVTATRYADSIARRGRAVAMTILAAIQRPTQKAMECQCCARVTHAGLRVGGQPLEAWLAFACTAHAAGLVAPRELSTAGYWLRWPRYTTMPR